MSLRTNALLLAVLTVLMAIVGEWEPQGLFIGWWALPGAVLLAGLAYESFLVRRSGVALRLEVPEALYLGRPATVRFLLHHRLSRSVTVKLAPRAPAFVDIEEGIAVVPVAVGAVAALERRITACRLGKCTWPTIDARIAGPLGLAWWPRHLAVTGRSRVLPDLLESAAEVSSLASRGAMPAWQAASGAELLRLRDFQEGDSPRLIDWKATARSGRMISRDFAQERGLNVLLLVDAGRSSALRAGHLDRYGHYANVAARLAQYAVTREDLVGIVIYADQPLASTAPARGVGAVMRIRQLLATTEVASTESNPLAAVARARTLVQHRSLIVVLTDFDDVTAHGQLVQAIRFLQPKHLPFIAGLSSVAAESMALAPATHWLDPYRALAAQEYVVSLKRKVQALNALGAPALASRPALLEGAVFAAYENFCRRRRVS